MSKRFHIYNAFGRRWQSHSCLDNRDGVINGSDNFHLQHRHSRSETIMQKKMFTQIFNISIIARWNISHYGMTIYRINRKISRTRISKKYDENIRSKYIDEWNKLFYIMLSTMTDNIDINFTWWTFHYKWTFIRSCKFLANVDVIIYYY